MTQRPWTTGTPAGPDVYRNQHGYLTRVPRSPIPVVRVDWTNPLGVTGQAEPVVTVTDAAGNRATMSQGAYAATCLLAPDVEIIW